MCKCWICKQCKDEIPRYFCKIVAVVVKQKCYLCLQFENNSIMALKYKTSSAKYEALAIKLFRNSKKT